MLRGLSAAILNRHNGSITEQAATKSDGGGSISRVPYQNHRNTKPDEC